MDVEPLRPDDIEDAIRFVSASNPFAQHAWGWDTGRFIDWRWGTNILKEERMPGWFSRHCTVVRRGRAIEALVICEDGAAEHCVITRDADPGLVGTVVDRLVARSPDGGLRFSCADDATWLREVFAARGFSAEPTTGCEWEFDLDALPSRDPLAAGFVVEASRTGDGADHAGITRCLQRAFGSETDLRPVLRSLESNPWYRTELSVVARAPDGQIAAYCRGTADPDTGVCGIDPVATDPDSQRRGLGRAILQRCFEAQRALGGRRCYIGSAPEPAPGAGLYRSLGPSKVTVFSTWSRPVR